MISIRRDDNVGAAGRVGRSVICSRCYCWRAFVPCPSHPSTAPLFESSPGGKRNGMERNPSMLIDSNMALTLAVPPFLGADDDDQPKVRWMDSWIDDPGKCPFGWARADKGGGRQRQWQWPWGHSNGQVVAKQQEEGRGQHLRIATNEWMNENE